ncbi:MAG: putative protein-disulfide isomerase [Planctomycetota bacterium]|jgi:putative protein-disulfide isomerase
MELVYLADPMCSWCWGFSAVLGRIQAGIADGVTLRYVMGGLAPDSDEPMPDAVQAMVRGAWGAVEATTGASFNPDFWTQCQPRRSTYPACRAVLAAESLEPGAGLRMFHRIQRAYYLEARNPSDVPVLEALAADLGLNREAFSRSLASAEIEAALQRDVAESARLGAAANAAGFPTLILRSDGEVRALNRGYATWDELRPSLVAAGVLRSP